MFLSLVALLMWRRPPSPPPLFTKQWTKVPTAWRRENNPDFIFRSLAFKLVLGSNSQLTRKNDFVITRQDSTLLVITPHLGPFTKTCRMHTWAVVVVERKQQNNFTKKKKILPLNGFFFARHISNFTGKKVITIIHLSFFN